MKKGIAAAQTRLEAAKALWQGYADQVEQIRNSQNCRSYQGTPETLCVEMKCRNAPTWQEAKELTEKYGWAWPWNPPGQYCPEFDQIADEIRDRAARPDEIEEELKNAADNGEHGADDPETREAITCAEFSAEGMQWLGRSGGWLGLAELDNFFPNDEPDQLGGDDPTAEEINEETREYEQAAATLKSRLLAWEWVQKALAKAKASFETDWLKNCVWQIAANMQPEHLEGCLPDPDAVWTDSDSPAQLSKEAATAAEKLGIDPAQARRQLCGLFNSDADICTAKFGWVNGTPPKGLIYDPSAFSFFVNYQDGKPDGFFVFEKPSQTPHLDKILAGQLGECHAICTEFQSAM